MITVPHILKETMITGTEPTIARMIGVVIIMKTGMFIQAIVKEVMAMEIIK
jgi:hypothetical protein